MDELLARDIIKSLPPKTAAAVTQAINKEDWDILSKLLAAAFPDCKTLIMKKQKRDDP